MPQYTLDPNHRTSQVTVRGHAVTITLEEPTDATRELGGGERAVCHIKYSVAPISNMNPPNPCTWSGYAFDFCESGRMRIRRGLPSNFIMPVDVHGHLQVRGVNS